MKRIPPVFCSTKPWERTKDTEKFKKLQIISGNKNF